MKRTLALVLCLLLGAAAAGCGNAGKETQPTQATQPTQPSAAAMATVPEIAAPSTAPAETAAPETPVPQTQPAVPDKDPVSVRGAAYAEADTLERVYRYEDSTEEYSIEILVSTTWRVTNFRYLELSFDGQDYDIIATLYSPGALDPDTTFSTAVSFPGRFPSRGISFVDPTGTVRFYALTLDLQSGIVSMEEFTQ